MAENSLVLIAPSSDLEVIAFYNEAIRLREYAEARVIVTNDDLKPANDDLAIIARVKKGMEAKRKDYLSPFQNHVKEVNEAYKTLMEPVEQADKITRNKILAFSAEQERKRREAEAIEAEKLVLAGREAKLKGGEFTVDLSPVAKPEAVPDRIRTDMGSSGQRDNWTYEVIDFTILPDEYKVADTTMLNAIAKKHHDQKQVPGVKFFNKPILAVNTR